MFCPKISKKGIVRGTDFSIFVFLRPCVGLVEVKKVPLPAEHPRTPFCLSTLPFPGTIIHSGIMLKISFERNNFHGSYAIILISLSPKNT